MIRGKQGNIFDSPAMNKFVQQNYLDYLAKEQSKKQKIPNIVNWQTGASTAPNEIAVMPIDEESRSLRDYDSSKLTPEEFEAVKKLEDSGYFDMMERQEEREEEWGRELSAGNDEGTQEFFNANTANYNDWKKEWQSGIKAGDWTDEDFDNAMKALHGSR